MAKSLQQRVRAQLERAEKARKTAADRAHDARLHKAEREALASETRIDAIIDGRAEPRTPEEWRIRMRAEQGLEE